MQQYRLPYSLPLATPRYPPLPPTHTHRRSTHIHRNPRYLRAGFIHSFTRREFHLLLLSPLQLHQLMLLYLQTTVSAGLGSATVVDAHSNTRGTGLTNIEPERLQRNYPAKRRHRPEFLVHTYT